MRKGAQAGKTILSVDPEGCRNLLPETFKRYFELYFSDLKYGFDRQGMASLLFTDASDFNFQFRTAAQRFNIIDNQRQVSVVVRYEQENVERLINELRYKGASRNLMRKLQRYTVSIPEKAFYEVNRSFEDVNGIWWQCADTLYDNKLGFVGYEGDIPIM